MPSKVSSKRTEHPISGTAARRDRRPKRRALFFPAHPDQRIEGNGRKYFLHLLSPEELQQRGMTSKQARLVINAYPVLVPHHQTRSGGAQRALGTEGSMGAGGPCGSHSRQPHGG